MSSYHANSGAISAKPLNAGRISIVITADKAAITFKMTSDEAEHLADGIRETADLARRLPE